MSDWPVNPLDLIIIAILLLSAILAMVRGFVREVLAIAGWIGAAFVTIWGLPEARPYARQYITDTLIADVLTGVVLFVVSLLVFSVIGHYVAKGVRGSAMQAVDRFLGFLFGVFRGALLVCLAYLLMLWLMPDEEQRPDWLREAQAVPYLERGSSIIEALVPQDRLAEGIADAETTVRDRLTGPPAPAREAPDTPPNYDRQGLDQLIDNAGDEQP